jgi:WASH complex subunit strumpellin
MEFLSVENVCGQNLLRLTSRGSAIIAELLRLADNIPNVIKEDIGITASASKLDPEEKKYLPLLFGFEYLQVL